MSIKLTILGCHSATPRTFAHPTAQYLEIRNQRFLIDCGEGTQTQLRKYSVKFSSVNHIFISHLHGDHYFGLMGLITTFGLHKRTADLHIYAPQDLEEIINLQLQAGKARLLFNLIFHPLKSSGSETVFENDKIRVKTIPLKHRIYTNGFLFEEKPGERRLNIEAIKKYPEIEICDYQNLKNGKDFIREDGVVIKNESVTFAPPKPLKYAFCSDTAYKPDIIPIIKNTDLLYHEATFLTDREDTARKTLHSTAAQAAKIAKKADVGTLIIGHFSSRYKDLNLFKEEAEKYFDKVVLAAAGKVISIDNKIPEELVILN